MGHQGTYSPEDNKLRLYPACRLDKELYTRVRSAGFIWAPKQEIFVAPMWTPDRADLLTELAGEIEDEDKSLVERADDRAERFSDYSQARAKDADQAHKAVAAIADNIPFGQPILVGHHSERHARKDAEKITNGMRKAVKMWETANYWKERARGAIRAAKYKERPDVRARRIKGLEADKRKQEKIQKDAEGMLHLWELVDQPEKWKANAEGQKPDRVQRAQWVANRSYLYVHHEGPYTYTAWDVLRPDGERYQKCPAYTVDQVLEKAREAYPRQIAGAQRWLDHINNRLEYERAMLADAGGTVTDKTGPEVGGGCRCWASHRGGWSWITKVNKVSVTVLDNWGNGGGNFTRTIPFDKLAAVMTKAEVEKARAEGRLQESEDKTGYLLAAQTGTFGTDHDAELKTLEQAAPLVKDPELKADIKEAIQAMKETLKAGVQVVTANQLFPTPPDLARRMVWLAGLHKYPPLRILEPSAGTGNILRELKPWVTADIVAIEINHSLVEKLACMGISGLHIRRADFLDFDGVNSEPFDRIIMNPPFQDGADIKHIKHALNFLKPGGRLVAICANGPRQQEQLKPLADSWEELPADTFKAEGTGVHTALLVINKKEEAPHGQALHQDSLF